MRKSYSYTIGAFVGVIILVNLFFRNPSFKNLTEKANFEIKSNQLNEADETLLQLVLLHQSNIDNHYNYISNHFDIPSVRKVSRNHYEYRDDSYIIDLYNRFSKSDKKHYLDIGHYGKGFILVQQKNYKSAILEFQQVKNVKLKYLNNSLGNAYEKLNNVKLAEYHFRKEIKNKGNLDGAYSNLFELLAKQKRWKELNHFLTNSELKSYIPTSVKREFYFQNGYVFSYIGIVFLGVFSGFNFWGFLAASLIMGTWVVYLRKLDLFEVELWKHIFIALGLGVLSCFLVFPLSDINNFIFGFDLNGEILNDFLYCVFGIGLIEELVKIIPLLLLIRFTNAVNEPFDYIKFASLSALGFAFVENIIYFDEDSLNIIHGRALTSVISHMFNSSIIGYGLFLNKYKFKQNPILVFILFLLIASLSHGFYDFWLINEKVQFLSIITVVYTLLSAGMWNTLKNNTLNQSQFFDKDKLLDGEQLQDYLLYSLSGIVLFEYIALGINYSHTAANNGLYNSIFSGTYLILYFSSSISKFNLVKDEWVAIKIFGNTEKYVYAHLLSFEYNFKLYWGSNMNANFFPNTGKITRKITISKEEDWFIVKLDQPQSNPDYLSDVILIRTKDREEQIDHKTSNLLSFFLIPTDFDFERTDAIQDEFKFCGFITMKKK